VKVTPRSNKSRARRRTSMCAIVETVAANRPKVTTPRSADHNALKVVGSYGPEWLIQKYTVVPVRQSTLRRPTISAVWDCVARRGVRHTLADRFPSSCVDPLAITSASGAHIGAVTRRRRWPTGLSSGAAQPMHFGSSDAHDAP